MQKFNENPLKKNLVLNLYVTQTIILAIAVALIAFLPIPIVDKIGWKGGWSIVYWGLGLAAITIALDHLISRMVPADLTDDGGINELLFRGEPIWHIACMALFVACAEELLFRGVIQHYMGIYWTSVLFAAIHIRYLRHWLMTAMVFGTSYCLGWVYEYTGSLWTPILAHFSIDFVMGWMIRNLFKNDTN